MFRTLSELLTICKQNMGLRDLPKPVTDEDLMWRITHSALKEFSQRYPYKETYLISECNKVCRPNLGVANNWNNTYSQIYQIPKNYYQEHTIMSITNVTIQRPSGYNDLYLPQGIVADPAAVMVGLASIQATAALAKQMTHSLTWDFRAPDILVIYNGWSGGTYEIELALDHDPSLSTIPPSAMSSFEELCLYDLQEYLYQKLKRVQDLDLGVGTIELKIDEWADASSKKKDLLADWDESCALDNEHIQFW